jgi:hypothetical protein
VLTTEPPETGLKMVVIERLDAGGNQLSVWYKLEATLKFDKNEMILELRTKQKLKGSYRNASSFPADKYTFEYKNPSMAGLAPIFFDSNLQDWIYNQIKTKGIEYIADIAWWSYDFRKDEEEEIEEVD